ncbi:hypothetical protein GCM10028819_42330 [Spirosoma humi]
MGTSLMITGLEFGTEGSKFVLEVNERAKAEKEVLKKSLRGFGIAYWSDCGGFITFEIVYQCSSITRLAFMVSKNPASDY